MPRDGSGNYTLPSGNPVVTNTLIESAWANGTMGDVAVQLNNVLTRDGLLGPINPFKLVDGAVATPGLAFNSEPGLGLFRFSTAVMAIAAVNGFVAAIDASSPTTSVQSFYPRTAGIARIVLNTDVQGSANTTQLQIEQNTTEGQIKSVGVGTGLAKPIRYTASSHIFEGIVPFVGALGQCRLAKSGANLVLTPYQGNKIAINGVVYTIPAAGISLTNATTVLNTKYYIYVLQTAGVLSLEVGAFATGHSTDATYGQEIKTGDPSRTLVGWARTATGSNVWVDQADIRWVSSWFNRKLVGMRAASGISANWSGAATELNPLYRCNFFNWLGDCQHFNLNGNTQNTNAGAVNSTSLNLDSAGGIAGTDSTVPSAAGFVPTAISTPIFGMTEDQHYVTMFVSVNVGTGTWSASNQVSGQVMA